MKHSFDLDNFESFLSEQADRHRMYPGDRVWRSIQRQIHGTDRWPALTFGSILTLATLAVVLTISYPKRNLFTNPTAAKDFAQVTAVVGNEAVRNSPASSVQNISAYEGIDARPAYPSVSATAGFSLVKTEENMVPLTPASHNNTADGLAAVETVAPAAGAEEVVTSAGASIITYLPAEETGAQFTAGRLLPLLSSVLPQTNAGLYMVNEATAEFTQSLAQSNETLGANAFLRTTMGYGPVNAGSVRNKRDRWSLQLYATPSISYRYLLEDKKYVDDPSAINGPLAPYLTHPVNEFVRHKAKMGVEAGASILYSITDNFRLKTGLQLNYRQYGIQAFATFMQPAILTLNRSNGVDSLIRYSNISAQNGYRALNLSSNSLQVAVPIGFDLKMAQFKNIGFYLSATGQLTYQIANNSYILSADYKNYLKQPDLDRNFNINTAVEAFLSFDAGGVTWQAGPQIRYQMLPGTTSAYPIREHLIDYGLKVGVVKTLK